MGMNKSMPIIEWVYDNVSVFHDGLDIDEDAEGWIAIPDRRVKQFDTPYPLHQGYENRRKKPYKYA